MRNGVDYLLEAMQNQIVCFSALRLMMRFRPTSSNKLKSWDQIFHHGHVRPQSFLDSDANIREQVGIAAQQPLKVLVEAAANVHHGILLLLRVELDPNEHSPSLGQGISELLHQRRLPATGRSAY